MPAFVNEAVLSGRGKIEGIDVVIAIMDFRFFGGSLSSGAGELIHRVRPIVKQMTSKVQLAEQYNSLAGQAASFGLVKQEDANIDNYVTRKALDGLYLVIAEQERAIRKDPVGAATGMAQKVFGMIGK
jgi:hypothetical protein